MTVQTEPAQVHTRQNHGAETGTCFWYPIPNQEAICIWRPLAKRNQFSQSVIGYIKHISGRSHSQESLANSKQTLYPCVLFLVSFFLFWFDRILFFVFSFCYIWYCFGKRQREYEAASMKLCDREVIRLWERLGRGKN